MAGISCFSAPPNTVRDQGLDVHLLDVSQSVLLPVSPQPTTLSPGIQEGQVTSFSAMLISLLDLLQVEPRSFQMQMGLMASPSLKPFRGFFLLFK